MFVVRIDIEHGPADFKVYRGKNDAIGRFYSATTLCPDDGVSSVALFRVADHTDVRATLDAVKQGNKDEVDILQVWPPDLRNVDLGIVL